MNTDIRRDKCDMEKFDSINVSSARNMLRIWREGPERNSYYIIRIWEELFNDNTLKLGSEKQIILEQITVASLDYSRLDVADKCLTELRLEFPDSNRVHRLKSMRQELIECYEEAFEYLTCIIKTDDTNPSPRKRKIAILRTTEQKFDAIRETCSYLTKFMSDQEAWNELCYLYLEETEYIKAIFCLEELILHNPHSYLFHIRLGDIRYTVGDNENVELAQSNYLCAIRLNPGNIRALYGLYLCCQHIMNSKAVTGKQKEAQMLCLWVLTTIREKFSELRKFNTSNFYVKNGFDFANKVLTELK